MMESSPIHPAILVVDDEPGLRALLQWELGSRGMIVQSARNGTEAAEMVRERRFDVVITDLSMPQGDGLSVLENMQQLYPGAPVIIATGFSTVEAAVYAMQQGAYDVILKPLDLEALVVRIHGALRYRHQCRTCGAALPSKTIIRGDPL